MLYEVITGDPVGRHRTSVGTRELRLSKDHRFRTLARDRAGDGRLRDLFRPLESQPSPSRPLPPGGWGHFDPFRSFFRQGSPLRVV